MNSSLEKKIIRTSDYDEANRSIESVCDAIIFTNGCFDVLHPGHISTLEFCDEYRKMFSAKWQANYHVVVAINSDESVRSLKGPNRPIFNQEERMIMLASTMFVDHVIVFNEETPLKLIEALNPVLIIKGPDYLNERIVGNETSSVEIVPESKYRNLSTTKIIERIRR